MYSEDFLLLFIDSIINIVVVGCCHFSDVKIKIAKHYFVLVIIIIVLLLDVATDVIV